MARRRLKTYFKFVSMILIVLSVLIFFFTGCIGDLLFKNFDAAFENAFIAAFPEDCSRVWLGPDYWANPLQDWRVDNGRIECVESGGDRNMYLLTRELSDENESFGIVAKVGRLEEDGGKLDEGWVGFKVGVRGDFNDYRDSAVRGEGFRIGVHTDGRLFIGNVDESAEKVISFSEPIALGVIAEFLEDTDTYKIRLEVYKWDPDNEYDEQQKIAEISRDDVDPDWLVGGVALVCSSGKVKDMPEKRPTIEYGNWGFKPGTQRGGNVKFWFENWMVVGSKVKAYPERALGPILFSQYTLSDGIMKMTAQMPPIGENDSQLVELQTKEGESWNSRGSAQIDKLARTATFRIENWDSDIDTPYRLVYHMKEFEGEDKEKEFYREGTVRKEPVDKEEFVIAAFCCQNDLGFPHNEITKSVAFHDPDMMFFAGDQIYEGVAGYGTQGAPFEKAAIDYLRKWYLYGWAFGELMKDRPTVSIPDDHDVYHGNLWGAGGKATPKELRGAAAQDEGGYKMPAEWVNMVERTQTSNLPDPYNPSPVEQGIGVYYCNMNYGPVSFAIVEDRKFKSAPKPLLPEADVWNGFYRNRDFDIKKYGDVATAELLGARQLDFLNDWTGEWGENTYAKMVLTQTLFTNLATLPAGEKNDQSTPGLAIPKEGEYVQGDEPVADMDSNGWPPTGRNNALKEFRRAFALHICGDQHLGSVTQYGIDEWRDASFSFCVPAISNVWPRRWWPPEAGANREEGSPKYTGDFEDGFGNKMTVYAVANPMDTGMKPPLLYNRATGYGIVRLNQKTRDITMECWPRLSDPSKAGAKQYPGWPVKINQLDNYARKAAGYLPTIETNIDDPIVQIINEEKNEIVYTIRIKGRRFEPKIFEKGTYMIKAGTSTEKMKVIKNVKPINETDGEELLILNF